MAQRSLSRALGLGLVLLASLGLAFGASDAGGQGDDVHHGQVVDVERPAWTGPVSPAKDWALATAPRWFVPLAAASDHQVLPVTLEAPPSRPIELLRVAPKGSPPTLLIRDVRS